MDKYLVIITTALVITQIIRVAQNTIQLYRQTRMMKKRLPLAVDTVEVVRCKDCIGWTTWLKTKEPSVSMCGLSGLYVGNHRDDLFCPYGESREEDAAD